MSAPRKTKTRYCGRSLSARPVPASVGAGPRPARRVRLLFTAALRRGGPRGRPPGTARGLLGCALGRGVAPTFPCRRRRGQSRNRGRTLCAPTKNVIRCGGRMLSVPTQNGIPIQRADNIRPCEKRESGVGNGACPPHEKRKPGTVCGTYPPDARRFVRCRGRSQTGPPGSAPLHGSPP